MKSIIFICSLITIISSSCSIEKRVYNNGYHVTWNSLKTIESKKEKERTEHNIPKENIKSLICEDEKQIKKERQEKTFYTQKIKEIQKSGRKKTETFLITKISGPNKNKIKELRKKEDFSNVRDIAQSKSENQSSTDELEELILKVLLIILILILIGILLTLLGGILGALFSILLFLLIIYIVLKISDFL